jgi:polysaccharide biosynthesis/export protein
LKLREMSLPGNRQAVTHTARKEMSMNTSNKSKILLTMGVSLIALNGCSSIGGGPDLPQAPAIPYQQQASDEYLIGPLDTITIFVWRNQELGAKVQVRPDGRITTPLITDMPAAGKTATMLQQDIKLALTQYINDPIVSVIVNEFAANNSQQIRIAGAGVEKPASVPYRANMTLLDAITAVGGISQYASGNKARLQRMDRATGRMREYGLKISDLLRKGDTRANVMLQPGDVIIIPESAF